MARNDRVAAMTGAGREFFSAIINKKDPYAAYDRVLAAYKMVGEGMELQGKMKELEFKQQQWPEQVKQMQAETRNIEADVAAKGQTLTEKQSAYKRLQKAIEDMEAEEGESDASIELKKSLLDLQKARLAHKKETKIFKGEEKAGLYEVKPESEVAGFQSDIAKSKVSRATDVARYNLGVPKATAEVEAIEPMAKVRNIMSETLVNIDKLKSDPATLDSPYVKLLAHFDELGVADQFSKEWDRMIELRSKSLAVDAGANPVQVALGLQIPNANPGMSPDDAKKAILDEYNMTVKRINEWWLKDTGFNTEQLLKITPPDINYKFPSGRPIVPPTGTEVPRPGEGQIRTTPTATLPQNAINTLDALSKSLMQDPAVKSMDDVREILNLPETRAKLGIDKEQIEEYLNQSSTTQSQVVPEEGTYISPVDVATTKVGVLANSHKVDPYLLLAIASQESGINPKSPKSNKGAVGIMQIVPSKAGKDTGFTEAELKNPANNIKAGIRYLAKARDDYGANTLDKMIKVYAGGPTMLPYPGYLEGVKAKIAKYKKDPNLFYKDWARLEKAYNSK